MFAEERKQRILAALQRAPSVHATELARAFATSLASIRRDLAELERSGLLTRTHGGAISNSLAGSEASLAQKEDRHQTEKAAIAAAAASLVQPGDVVFLDAGSTTRQIARELRHRRDITVVTNAINVAGELASSAVEVILTGGQLRRGVLSQVGPIAEQTIAALHVDRLFLAANGVDPDKGVTTPNLGEARTKRAMIDSAREVVLVADHSKFGVVAFAHICGLDRLHAIITDDGLPARVARQMAKRGIRVHLAPGRTAAARARRPRA